jgi:hypothetical protein
VAVYGPVPQSKVSSLSAPTLPLSSPPVLPPSRSLLGVGHVTAGELIPGRLLSPIEVEEAWQQQEKSQQRRQAGVQPISQI